MTDVVHRQLVGLDVSNTTACGRVVDDAMRTSPYNDDVTCDACIAARRLGERLASVLEARGKKRTRRTRSELADSLQELHDRGAARGAAVRRCLARFDALVMTARNGIASAPANMLDDVERMLEALEASSVDPSPEAFDVALARIRDIATPPRPSRKPS